MFKWIVLAANGGLDRPTRDGSRASSTLEKRSKLVKLQVVERGW